MDWEGIEHSAEFRELIKKRRSFVVPATIFFLAYYFGFILLAGYAPDFMGRSVYEGLTVGYVLALSQFVMVWGLVWLYNRVADRVLDPMRREAARRGLRGEATGRFARDAVTTTASEEATR